MPIARVFPGAHGTVSHPWTLAVIAAVAALAVVPARALEPPTPGEVAEMARTGTLAKQLERASALGNHRIDARLLRKAITNARRAALTQQGYTGEYVDAVAPAEPAAAAPPYGMRTTGVVKILALLIEFNDYTHAATNTRDYVHSGLFGEGVSMNHPYESLKNYYARSSYGQLDLSPGTTLGWYRTAYDRPLDPVGSDAPIVASLVEEAIRYYDSRGHDFTQYDADGDGTIDYFIVIWTGPAGPWASLWWGWMSDFHGYDSAFTVDGKKLGRFSWQWEANPVGYPFTPRVVTHETGHALGLPDLYDYDPSVGPRGGVGGLDMMDANLGDHNCFSKWVLGWTTPTFVGAGWSTVHLQPSATTPECVVTWPGVASDDLFSEFFVAQNRQRVANDTGTPADGMLVWHVDATLSGNASFAYNNSYTAHKLVRLMEADGLEQIEQGGRADAGDYWQAGHALDVATVPSSRRYDGRDSGVAMSELSSPGVDMFGKFEVASWWDRPMQAPPVDFVGRDGPVFDEGTRLVDLDGDGKLDLIQGWYNYGAVYRGAWRNTSGTFSPSVAYAPPVDFAGRDGSSPYGWDSGLRFADLNGDGKPDLVQGWYNWGTSYRSAWLNNGGNCSTSGCAWTQAPAYAPPVEFSGRASGVQPWDNGLRLADLNGDGKPDLVQGLFSYGAYVRNAWINNGSGWTRSSAYAAPADFAGRASGVSPWDGGLRIADLNGDGRPDLIQGLFSYGSYSRNAWINTGTGWYQSSAYAPPEDFAGRASGVVNWDNGLRLADVNGDGKADLLHGLWSYGTSFRRAWVNTGSGWSQDPGHAPPAEFVGRGSGVDPWDNGLRLADLNADAKPDLIQGLFTYGTYIHEAWINDGTTWAANELYRPPSEFAGRASGVVPWDNGLRLADLDGDGKPDLIQGLYSYGASTRKTWIRTR